MAAARTVYLGVCTCAVGAGLCRGVRGPIGAAPRTSRARPPSPAQRGALGVGSVRPPSPPCLSSSSKPLPTCISIATGSAHMQAGRANPMRATGLRQPREGSRGARCTLSRCLAWLSMPVHPARCCQAEGGHGRRRTLQHTDICAPLPSPILSWCCAVRRGIVHLVPSPLLLRL